MKKIFKIKFELIDSNDKALNRDQKILFILSELKDIESDSPLPIPEKTSLISINSNDFIIMELKCSFDIIDEIFYYTTILKIKSLEQCKREEIKRKEMDDTREIRAWKNYADLRRKFY